MIINDAELTAFRA